MELGKEGGVKGSERDVEGWDGNGEEGRDKGRESERKNIGEVTD